MQGYGTGHDKNLLPNSFSCQNSRLAIISRLDYESLCHLTCTGRPRTYHVFGLFSSFSAILQGYGTGHDKNLLPNSFSCQNSRLAIISRLDYESLCHLTCTGRPRTYHVFGLFSSFSVILHGCRDKVVQQLVAKQLLMSKQSSGNHIST